MALGLSFLRWFCGGACGISLERQHSHHSPHTLSISLSLCRDFESQESRGGRKRGEERGGGELKILLTPVSVAQAEVNPRGEKGEALLRVTRSASHLSFRRAADLQTPFPSSSVLGHRPLGHLPNLYTSPWVVCSRSAPCVSGRRKVLPPFPVRTGGGCSHTWRR